MVLTLASKNLYLLNTPLEIFICDNHPRHCRKKVAMSPQQSLVPKLLRPVVLPFLYHASLK